MAMIAGTVVITSGDIASVTEAPMTTLFEVETKAAHGLRSGDSVELSFIVGAVGSNGVWGSVTVIDATHFTLDGSTWTLTTQPGAGGSWLHVATTGLAGALWDQRYPILRADVADAIAPILAAGGLGPTFVQLMPGKTYVAQNCVADATALVTYMQANAVATISTESAGRIPSSTSAGTPIDAPAIPVLLPIT